MRKTLSEIARMAAPVSLMLQLDGRRWRHEPTSLCTSDCAITPAERAAGGAAADKSRDSIAFAIMTYNTLLPHIALGGQFSYCPRAYREWPYRCARILDTIRACAPAAVLLQEAGSPVQRATLQASMNDMGYDNFGSTYFRRDVFEPIARWKVDTGKESAPTSTHADAAGYLRWPTSLPHGTPSDAQQAYSGLRASVRAYHKVSWAVLLRVKREGFADSRADATAAKEGMERERFLLLFGLHTLSDPYEPDSKVLQVAVAVHAACVFRAQAQRVLSTLGTEDAVRVLRRHVTEEWPAVWSSLCAAHPRLAAHDDGDADEPAPVTRIPMAFAGDLNSLPQIETASEYDTFDRARGPYMSGVYQLLSTGELPRSHPHHPVARRDLAAGFAPIGDMLHIRLPVRFRSAYATVMHREPAWTNWTRRFRACIDYIWISDDCDDQLEVCGVLDAPDDERVRAHEGGEGGCPNAAFPSDHIPLIAHVHMRS